MNIEDVIKVCGQLPQTPKNMPDSNKKSNAYPIVAVLIIGGLGYWLYRQWKREKDLEKNSKYD